MEQPEASLETVQGWWKESLKFSRQSDDALLSLITKAFETISVALSQDSEHSMETIASLDNERKLALQLENEDFDVLRHFTFGLIESLQIALFHLRGKKNVMQSQETRAKHSTVDPLLAKEPKEEPIDVSQVFPDDNQLFSHNSKEEEEEVACKEEEIDDLDHGFGFADDAADDTYPNQMGFEDMDDPVEFEKYTDTMENSDDESRIPVKKARSDSVKKMHTSLDDVSESKRRKHRIEKRNETEMKCPECEFCTRSAYSWLNHLRMKHSTTCALAGLALLCECGVECTSYRHRENCNIANFTVIRKRDGPIRRVGDEKITPKCVLCETYPKTARGYIRHLGRHHKSTLSANGIYLICMCGLIVRNGGSRHSKTTCDGREFSLHKLEDSIITGSNLILPRQTGKLRADEAKEELME